ncbi:Water stress and hypersensitive response domain-containing protein [Burkholderia stagnalis]|uniref:Water stress and hypersensitive response domain-containing protein n=1 Tax=Burkholderia stagnalis TaxID=1503054 RepID=A0A3P0EVC7_9BURK|nr:LEA type 2 family protein [Burkholderia stagnalis]KAB0635808.1 Water stress and hypersensitive response domain-containing protein [Burkholderia stagnalis]KVM99626.1 Water stress and hypersensitive response domain-containing protein [Burkholderia stagnalis]KVN32059.1 Water stress and hypersensitive response domain-containing protein [Burkholderia stagnalis]KVN63347.1 Water stress and hypersensitive response domain-containing protein [Burkholderia stagnalis]KVO49796.1 Water stress and hyperse
MSPVPFRAAPLRAILLLVAAVLVLGGCAGLMPDRVHVTVAGLEPLVGQGLEMRFNLKLRVQNPTDAPIDYDGIAVTLELNGQPFASGVSDRVGVVPRFGEAVLDVPVSVSAFAAARQAWNLAGAASAGELPYALRGRLAGSAFGAVRFTDAGTLRLPAMPGWGG